MSYPGTTLRSLPSKGFGRCSSTTNPGPVRFARTSARVRYCGAAIALPIGDYQVHHHHDVALAECSGSCQAERAEGGGGVHGHGLSSP